MVNPQATKSQLEWSQFKFIKFEMKKGTVRKRETSKNRSRVFEIALEGGKEWKCLGELQLFNAFVMLKATFSFFY